MPWKILVRGGQDPPDEARSFGVDLAVGAHRTRGNLSNPSDDAGYARLMVGGVDLRLTFHVNRVQNAAPPVVIAKAFWTWRLGSFRWKVRSNSAST